MFQIDNPTVDLEYDIISKLSQVSLFLWHGSEGDRIRIHHASVTEWLTSDANKGKVFYVKKQNITSKKQKKHLKTEFMRGPGRCDTSHLSDFNETWSK